MEIGIVAQKDNSRAATLAADLAAEIRGSEVTVHVDEATASAIDIAGTTVEEMDQCAMVVSVGGDGTFLYTARHVGATPILGVNLGEVGFLNAVDPGEAPTRIREEVEHIQATGSPRFREVPRLVARGDEWSLPPGLNEVAVLGPRRGFGNGIDIEVRVDDALYTSGHADGVLIATPTGSTAYNLSEGGPLLHPGVDALVVTELCAMAAMPSLVVTEHQEVTVRASGAEEAIVSSDGERVTVETPAWISVSIDDEPGRIAGPQSDFFRALEKLEQPASKVDLS